MWSRLVRGHQTTEGPLTSSGLSLRSSSTPPSSATGSWVRSLSRSAGGWTRACLERGGVLRRDRLLQPGGLQLPRGSRGSQHADEAGIMTAIATRAVALLAWLRDPAGTERPGAGRRCGRRGCRRVGRRNRPRGRWRQARGGVRLARHRRSGSRPAFQRGWLGRSGVVVDHRAGDREGAVAVVEQLDQANPAWPTARAQRGASRRRPAQLAPPARRIRRRRVERARVHRRRMRRHASRGAGPCAPHLTPAPARRSRSTRAAGTGTLAAVPEAVGIAAWAVGPCAPLLPPRGPGEPDRTPTRTVGMRS
jgi:hypothetical protein